MTAAMAKHLSSDGAIDRKVLSFAEFSQDLLTSLSAGDQQRPLEPMLAELGHQINTINAFAQRASPFSKPTINTLLEWGQKLWNESVRTKRKADAANAPAGWMKLLARTKALGFLAHTVAREKNASSEDDIMHVASLACSVSGGCIDESDFDGARVGLQRIAYYIERLNNVGDHSEHKSSRAVTLEAKYLTLRTALAWKEGRLDVAEHMYNKATALRSHLDLGSAETMADTLNHIGNSLLEKGDFTMALKWLQRAQELIDSQNIDQLSTEGLELRLAICHDMVQTMIGIGTDESMKKADDLVSYMESELGDKPVVLHWRLEILQRSPSELFDKDACASIIRRMIRCIELSDAAIGFLLHSIKELQDKGSKVAIALLDEMLLSRLLSTGKDEWIGKAVIRRIWMSIVALDSSEGANSFQALLDRLVHDGRPIMANDATAAAHSKKLIWKHIDALFTKEQYHSVQLWCKIALNMAFSNCGDGNLGKFGRKLILCALNCRDFAAACAAFRSMPQTAQDDPLTRYLMFKASLIGWDHDLGRQSIEYLTKSTDIERSQDMLYSCIREAQQVGDRICALDALKAVAERHATGGAAVAHLPSILRCSIRLINLIEEASDDSSPKDLDLAEDMCKMFERAAEHSLEDGLNGSGGKLFTVMELEWFRKNAYNVGVSKCHEWNLPHVVRIFKTCLAFLKCYPADGPSEQAEDIQLMGMRSNFIVAAALVAHARVEDDIEARLQRYLEMRRHIAAFDASFEQACQENKLIRHDKVRADLSEKMSTLFVFDFEAAVCLKSWDDLSSIVRKARACDDPLSFKAMGDCLLRSNASGKSSFMVMIKTATVLLTKILAMYASMRLIINEIFRLERFATAGLAKYLRCMLQMMLPLDDKIALQIVDHTLHIANEGDQQKAPFPAEELDWIVATVFNHAIDLLARGDEATCHEWAIKSLHLAQFVGDGGDLQDMLREKIVKLGFSHDSHT